VNKKNHTKNDIINNLSKKSGFSFNYSKKLIDGLLIVLKHSIKKNRLILKNIGTFKVINKNQRIGRNPKTKEKFLISSRKSISFIASKKIFNILN
jgi:integration host factor subunit alpha